jgi:UDP-N-acetylmuramoyl-L-alanyl-D-glutamate--2,6-diaminopimelate ligase
VTSPPAALDSRPTTAPAVALADLVAELPVVGPAPTTDVRVSGLTLASGDVRAGDLYAALPGRTAHGASYVPGAIRAGAVAVLTDPAGAAAVAGSVPATGPGSVPLLVVADPRAVLGALAAAVYRYPARGMTMVGVTGTHGKTTVTYLLEAALRTAGRTPGLVGTTGSRANGRPVSSRLTTP